MPKCECGKSKSKVSLRCRTCHLKRINTNNSGWFKKGRKFKHSEETKTKITLSRIQNKNPRWAGDDIGYSGVHKWVRERKIKPKNCETCKNEPYDLANISGRYLRDVNDFEWLCRRCHMIKDGRLEKLKNVAKM